MAKIKRNCDNCGNEYNADTRNLKRGWGKCCNKSCAAQLREKSKSNYDPKRVERNNIRRALWNFNSDFDGHISGYTSEDYKIINGVAYNEYDEPMYDIDPLAGDYDPSDSEYWDNKDF